MPLSNEPNIVQTPSSCATFAKVLDGRKQPIRGLWERNGRYYAQITLENQISGEKKVRRVPLKDKDGKSVDTVPQALSEMNRLQIKRTDNELPVLTRTPKFADYVVHYLDFISSGQGTKKSGTIQKEFITKRLKAGLKPRTCNLDVISLRCCLKQARQDGWIQRLPMEGFKPLKTTTPRRPFFSTTDIERICQAALERSEDGSPVTKNGQQFADYVRLLAYSGARRNEALRLRWQDVDFDQEQLHIGSDGDTKNSETRTVDFNAKLKAHLQAMHKRSRQVSKWLFPSPQRGGKDIPRRRFVNHLTWRGFKRKCRTSLSMIAGTISFPCASCRAWIS
jgi:integrase